MKTIEVPARTVIQLKVVNPKQSFHWDRDERYQGLKTNIEVHGSILTATNYTQSVAVLTLDEE